MSTEIQVTSDATGALEKVKGSDGRLNASSRSDSRGYYNSRDLGQAYSVAFDFQLAESGEYGFYFKNTSSTGKAFVVSAIGVNASANARVKLSCVSGTAAGGTALTPVNMNLSSSHAATAIAMEGGSAATGITGLTQVALIDFLYVAASGHEEFRLDDRLRLGQNDAIALEIDEGTAADFTGVLFGYYEDD